MSVVSLAVRAWARYAVPLLALSVIVLAPVGLAALATPAATDVAHARGQLVRTWELLAAVWILQLVLVAGAAPAVRALARGEPLTRGNAFWAGLRAITRALVPCAIAVAAIGVGVAALVAPGLALVVLLALTGASDQLGEPMPAPLLDSVRAARANLWCTVAIVVAALVLDAAIVGIAQLSIARDLAKALAAPRELVRVVALVLVVVSPLSACALAATYERAPRDPA